MNSDTDEHTVINLNSNTLPDVCIVTSESQPLLPPSTPTTPNMDLTDDPHSPPWNTSITDDVEYADTIKQSERAIEGGILPIRIAAGSSGSYFVRNLEGVCVLSCCLFLSLKYFLLTRKPLESLNPKMKNPMVDSIRNGQNGLLSILKTIFYRTCLLSYFQAT